MLPNFSTLLSASASWHTPKAYFQPVDVIQVCMANVSAKTADMIWYEQMTGTHMLWCRETSWCKRTFSDGRCAQTKRKRRRFGTLRWPLSKSLSMTWQSRHWTPSFRLAKHRYALWMKHDESRHLKEWTNLYKKWPIWLLSFKGNNELFEIIRPSS